MMGGGVGGRAEAPSGAVRSAGKKPAPGFPRCRRGAQAAGWIEVAVDLGIPSGTAEGRGGPPGPSGEAETEEATMAGLLRGVRSTAGAVVALWWLVPAALLAQGTSPWVDAVTELQTQFTGPIARGLSLIAIVIGGLMFAFGEGGSKRTLAGIIFGLGMAMGAANFLAWLF